VLHILIDRDLEETYHALYMKETLDAAGLPAKILHGMGDVAWSEGGDVVDGDGVPIRWVWKTWAWETALDQLRAECEADEAAGDLPAAVTLPEARADRYPHPRLVDVLLRPEVMVYEPLWTLIPSNKAPLISSMIGIRSTSSSSRCRGWGRTTFRCARSPRPGSTPGAVCASTRAR